MVPAIIRKPPKHCIFFIICSNLSRYDARIRNLTEWSVSHGRNILVRYSGGRTLQRSPHHALAVGEIGAGLS